MKFRHTLAFGVALSAFSVPAFAQDQEAASDEAAESDNVIIVTAVARGQNRLESSVSVSSIGAEQIADLAPPSSADLIRQIPGIRAEASGGEGNANIAVLRYSRFNRRCPVHPASRRWPASSRVRRHHLR